MELRIKPKLDELNITMEEVTQEIAADLKQAVSELSKLTAAKAKELASERLHSTLDQFIEGLNGPEEIQEGIYVVWLDEEAHHLDEGYPPFPMLPKLAMGPKSKPYRDGGGGRYVVVPIRQSTNVSASASSKRQNLADKLNEMVAQRKEWKATKRQKTDVGRFRTVERFAGKAPHKHLEGLTRVREYASKESFEKGEPPTSSAYLTFRVASTRRPDKFQHPGFFGANVFADLSRWADQNMDQIVADIFNRKL